VSQFPPPRNAGAMVLRAVAFVAIAFALILVFLPAALVAAGT
jgi:hypothetical protein